MITQDDIKIFNKVNDDLNYCWLMWKKNNTLKEHLYIWFKWRKNFDNSFDFFTEVIYLPKFNQR